MRIYYTTNTSFLTSGCLEQPGPSHSRPKLQFTVKILHVSIEITALRLGALIGGGHNM